MRDLPSDDLLELLARLGPELPRQLPTVAKSVRKLAGVLPHFDSVWIDALLKARLITPFQAREVNGGRGRDLVVGPFVIQDRLQSLGFAEVYCASQILPPAIRPRSGQAALNCVLIICATAEQVPDVLLTQLVQNSKALESPLFCVVREAGQADGRIWLRADHVTGNVASNWLSENGRLPPKAVLQIARQLLAAMCEIETKGFIHGNICAKSLVLHDDGNSTLLFPGLRSALRPAEGIVVADLPSDCYETIAPELTTQGARANIVSDIFSCGCLFIQLLTGRPAIPGATPLAKISNLASMRIADVRQLAPDTPPVLAEMILACTNPEPHRRPQSFLELAKLLGPAKKQDNKWTSQSIARPNRWNLAQEKPAVQKTRIRIHALELSTAILCFVLAVISWRFVASPKNTVNPTPRGVEHSTSLGKRTHSDDVVQSTPVMAASFREDIAVITSNTTKVEKCAPLFLPTDRPLRLSSLLPCEGQMVCGKDGRRATIIVPAAGLDIAPSGVQFKDIDFVMEDHSNGPFLSVQSANARFERCTFLTDGSGGISRAAIQWRPSSSLEEEDWSAETDRLTFVDCIFVAVSAGISRSRSGEAEMEFRNVLCLNSGPLVESAPPAATERLKITLSHCTLREVNSIVMLHPSSGRTGRIFLETRDSVLCLRSGNAHIEVESLSTLEDQNPIEWKGQGTLIDMNSVLVATRNGDLEIEPLDEMLVNVTGIARSQMQFAGPASARISDSKLQRWVAPRKSVEPPGVVFQTLPLNTPRLTSEDTELRFQ